MSCYKFLVLVGFGLLLASPLTALSAEEPAQPATEATAPAAAEPAAEEPAEPAAEEPAAKPEEGLIAYWNFDAGEGETAKDSAGKNDAKIVSAKWVEGKVGKALEFDGQSAYVEAPHAEALNLTKAITIEAWVKYTGTSPYPWEAILAKGDTSYRIHFDETDQSFGMGLNGASGDFWNMASGVKPEKDKWQFFVATFDGKQACLYIDGKQAATTTDCPAEISTNTMTLCIGENSESYGRFFTGLIDEVKIYDRALTADEVTKHFQAVEGQEKGLVASWTFDEGEGETVKDAAGKNNGKIVNTKWVDGKFGKALDFNGQDSYVEIPDAPALGLTKAITMAAWVKHRNATPYSWEAILAKGDTTYRLHFDEIDGSFGMGLNGASGDFWNMASAVVPEADKWHLVVATFDGKQACLYVDGKQAATTTDCPTEISTNTMPLYIGENSEMYGRCFDGAIDEVKIYDRALSAEEVTKLFERKE